MWFKALRIYQASRAQDWTSEKLEKALAGKPFRHCAHQEEMTAGWVAPTGGSSKLLGQNGHWLLKLKIEEKILPAAVVREHLEARLKEIERSEGRKPGRKERQNLTDELRMELLPRAFTRSRSVWVWLDTENQRVLLDATSDKTCELALNLLREGLGSLPVIPLATRLPPSQVMTRWLEEQTPADLQVLDTCELRDPEDDKAVVRIKGQPLEGAEIAQHLSAGKRVTQLRLDWQEQLRFTLTDQLTFKSLQFADELVEEAENANPDQDPLVVLDTEFLLMSNTLSSLANRLISLHEGLTDSLNPAQQSIRG